MATKTVVYRGSVYHIPPIPHKKNAPNVYRGYMPIGLPQHKETTTVRPWHKVHGKPRVTLYPRKLIEGYSEQPEYPPLNDGSRKGLKTQTRLDWYDKIKTLPTVEEKLHEIINPATHMTANMSNWLSSHNPLPLTQYLTQTVLVNELPPKYKIRKEDQFNGQGQTTLDKLRDVVLNQVEANLMNSTKFSGKFSPKASRYLDNQHHVSEREVENIISAAKRYLSVGQNPELLDYQYDINPSLRSWWFHSGLPPPNNKIFYKSRKDSEGNINQLLQVNGATVMNIRSSNFIEPIVGLDNDLVSDLSLVPKQPYRLQTFGVRYLFKRPVTLPGFWYHSDAENDFPHTTVLNLDCCKLRNLSTYKINLLDDTEECLNGQSILTGFSWLNSLAMHHGFSPYQELTYPFTCHVIATDGQRWMFNIYQLNSHTFHRDLGGPRCNNICWSSGLLKLYDVHEGGQFKGINEDVVLYLSNFLSCKTSSDYTSTLNLKPYLSEDVRSQEEKDNMRFNVRAKMEQRENRWIRNQWKVPHWEHLFFRSKTFRNSIREMKPKFKPPKPQISPYFD